MFGVEEKWLSECEKECDRLRQALTAARDLALEEAAQAAETADMSHACGKFAAARIRALKEKP